MKYCCLSRILHSVHTGTIDSNSMQQLSRKFCFYEVCHVQFFGDIVGRVIIEVTVKGDVTLF